MPSTKRPTAAGIAPTGVAVVPIIPPAPDVVRWGEEDEMEEGAAPVAPGAFIPPTAARGPAKRTQACTDGTRLRHVKEGRERVRIDSRATKSSRMVMQMMVGLHEREREREREREKDGKGGRGKCSAQTKKRHVYEQLGTRRWFPAVLSRSSLPGCARGDPVDHRRDERDVGDNPGLEQRVDGPGKVTDDARGHRPVLGHVVVGHDRDSPGLGGAAGEQPCGEPARESS